MINATEKSADLQITGTSNQPAGTTITVTLNGQNYTAIPPSPGNRSATVPASAVSALGEANLHGNRERHRQAGNSNSASHNVLVNSACLPLPLTRWQPMTLLTLPKRAMRKPSARVTGAAAGDTVTVTLGGNTYTATVAGQFKLGVGVPAADIQALGNGDLTVNASVTKRSWQQRQRFARYYDRCQSAWFAGRYRSGR